MNIEVLKSKIHRVKITQAELHYVGILISYASMAHEEAKKHKPEIVFPGHNNRLA